jgi:inner membrane protein
LRGSPGGSADEAAIDPVCHTLVGAALGRSGLSRRTAYGTATLLIGANLPDIDIFAYLDGPGADLAFRRGWTHGIPAMIVLPLALTAFVVLLDLAVRRVTRATLPSSVSVTGVLRLAAIAVWTHPMLDTLNTYGVRWLMPFSQRWLYGDTLFIVDPWLWLILGIGILLSGERKRSRQPAGRTSRPARLALTVGSVYVALMALMGVASRRIAARELTMMSGEPVEKLMLGPTPLTPFVRQVVAAQGARYRTGQFRWLRRPHIDPATVRIYSRGQPASGPVASAIQSELGRRFLSWARFPVFQSVATRDGATLVYVIDLRYADRPSAGFGTVTIRVPPQTASASSSETRQPSGRAGPAARAP